MQYQEIFFIFSLLHELKKFLVQDTAQSFSIKDFFSKSGQILRTLQIQSHLLKISLMENFIFITVRVRFSFTAKQKIVFDQSCHYYYPNLFFPFFSKKWERLYIAFFQILFSEKRRFRTYSYLFIHICFRSYLDFSKCTQWRKFSLILTLLMTSSGNAQAYIVYKNPEIGSKLCILL